MEISIAYNFPLKKRKVNNYQKISEIIIKIMEFLL